MRTLRYIKTVALTLFCATLLTTSNLCFNTVTAQPVATPVTDTVTTQEGRYKGYR